VGWNDEQDRQRLLRIIIKRIEVAKGVVRVQIDPAAALADEAEGLRLEPQTVEIACDLVRGASGVQIAIGKESGNHSRRLDPALIKGVVRGYQWRSQLLCGEAESIAELARKAGVNSRYVVRTVRMGFLAPDIIEAILEGRQTAAVSFETFRQPLPLDWAAQRLRLGFVQSATCKDVEPGPELNACISSGGTIVSGSCHSDGACGGSPVCCEGVSVGESCTPTVDGGEIAQPDSCAATTEDDCDKLSAAGEHATDSVVSPSVFL
jgi:hypothetical protein